MQKMAENSEMVRDTAKESAKGVFKFVELSGVAFRLVPPYGGLLVRCSFRKEVVDSVISSENVAQVCVDLPVKPGDSSSNGSRDIQQRSCQMSHSRLFLSFFLIPRKLLELATSKFDTT